MLVFKNDENMIFEKIKYESFNLATLQALDVILNHKDISEWKFEVFQEFIYNSLIRILEIQDISNHESMKIHLNLKKSLFIKIITDPDSVCEADEIMQIINSKIYLFLNYAKKITRKIFYDLLTHKLLLKDLYQAYDKHVIIDYKIKRDYTYDCDPISSNYHKFTNDNIQKQIINPNPSVNTSRNLFYFENFVDYLSNSNNKSTTFPNSTKIEYMNAKKHPFNKDIEIFCDFLYHTFEFFIFDEQNNLIISVGITERSKYINSIHIKAEEFFHGLKLFEEESIKIMEFNHCSSSTFFSMQPYKFDFLQFFKEKYNLPHIELRYNLGKITTILHTLITIIHPKIIFLNISKFYSSLFFEDFQGQNNELTVENFNIFIQTILNKIYFLQLRIDGFCIELSKSRIFDITNLKIISNAFFTPSLYTSIQCLMNNTGNLFYIIAKNHFNNYVSSKQSFLKYCNFRSKCLKFMFVHGVIQINDINIVESIEENNVKQVNVIFEYKKCVIEIQKYHNDEIEKNVTLINDNKNTLIYDLENLFEMPSYIGKTKIENSESNIVATKETSFNIYLQNLMNIKSKSITSFALLTKKSQFSKLDIHNCKVDFLSPFPPMIQTIVIKNSFCLNIYSSEQLKQNIHHKNNTRISIKRSYFAQNTVAGIYQKITIHYCNEILRVTAQFEIIEMTGIFDEITILGEFYFHFKSKGFAVFTFTKRDKYLRANNVIFLDDSYLSLINSQNLTKCQTI